MKVYIQKIDPFAKSPIYAYEGDAGMDLFSCRDYKILPGLKGVISTGIKMAIPQGYAGFVWDKSGIAVKNHMKSMAGVIDSNYRGEVKVVLINLGSQIYNIKKGEKIAQLVIKPVESVQIVEVDELESNENRGESGFGSSGI